VCETSANGFETLSLWVSDELVKEGLYCLRCEDSLGAQVLVQVDFSKRYSPRRLVVELLLEADAILLRHL